MPRRREQVALVVIAPPVGQHQVLNGVDAAANPRDEAISLGGDAEVPAGQCWEAALAESFFSANKGELLDDRAWPTRAAARGAVTEYII
jgi:hypothetical protein